MSDEEVVAFSRDQRMPKEGEPVCVVCGKYGEYICDETEKDVCSLECKRIHLERVHQQQQIENGEILVPSCDDATFLNWRVGAYYRYCTWSNLYTNTDIVEIRRGLHITIRGEFYHSLISFESMYIPERIRENMTLLGIESPTPIQMESV
ncbi:hypothetical protein WA577_002651, partial [Blastocystis sp. JDR]